MDVMDVLDTLPRGPKPPGPVKFSDFTAEELGALSEAERGHLDWVVWMFAMGTKPEAVRYMRYLFFDGPL